MKFYETHFEDYCKSYEVFHDTQVGANLVSSPPKLPQPLGHSIVYGSSGVGKYTHVLNMLKPYSPSQLKYDKRIKTVTEKQSYTFRISDIHYEVDMSLLGCNSKILWHEVYKQIVDIITIKPDKIGFIVCKNFHTIHNELLEIFYSYMQQYCYGLEGRSKDVQVYFILITEHVSFLPNNLLNRCRMVRIPRPCAQDLVAFSKVNKDKDASAIQTIVSDIDTEHVMNIKEIYSFALVKNVDDLPNDNFILVCDTIIQEMDALLAVATSADATAPSPNSLTHFRDCLYDMLIYNLDGTECIWYILKHLLESGRLGESVLFGLMYKLSVILKQYGNNYRSIFHLENAIFSIMEAVIGTPLKR